MTTRRAHTDTHTRTKKMETKKNECRHVENEKDHVEIAEGSFPASIFLIYPRRGKTGLGSPLCPLILSTASRFPETDSNDCYYNGHRPKIDRATFVTDTWRASAVAEAIPVAVQLLYAGFFIVHPFTYSLFVCWSRQTNVKARRNWSCRQ